MMRTNPFDEMFERMTRGFDSPAMSRMSHRAFDVDVAEADGEVVVTADLPGFDREEIEVNVSDRTLTLRADHEHSDEHESGDEGASYLYRERSHESVSRSISLPADVDVDAARATYRNGVLTVSIPLRDAIGEGHRIEIE
jgi:HSP20 family protein